MRNAGAAAFLILAGVMPAVADEMPARKAGLWEIRTIRIEFHTRRDSTIGVPLGPFRQCADAATDEKLMSRTGFLSACPMHETKRSGDGVVIDSACTLMDENATTHTEITGSFDRAYTVLATYTMEGNSVPTGWAQMIEMSEGHWLGPCSADLKPGDQIMDDGQKK